MADISLCANAEACKLSDRCRRSPSVTKPHGWQSWMAFEPNTAEPEMCEGWWPWPREEEAA
jgi:hypothetical protein